MPEYIAVQCYACDIFQGMQNNKAKKFKCKICNEKQSVRRVWARSDAGKDIRIAVQTLNMKAAERRQAVAAAVVEPDSAEDSDEGNMPASGTRNNEYSGYDDSRGEFHDSRSQYDDSRSAYDDSRSVYANAHSEYCDEHAATPRVYEDEEHHVFADETNNANASQWTQFLDKSKDDDSDDDLQLDSDDEAQGDTVVYVTESPDPPRNRRRRRPVKGSALRTRNGAPPADTQRKRKAAAQFQGHAQAQSSGDVYGSFRKQPRSVHVPRSSRQFRSRDARR